jgi:CRP/FNR family transcriptional regulator, anaerobic regulatory protein
MQNPLLSAVYKHPLLLKEEIEKIIQGHTHVTFKKGDFILKENQISNAYYIIETGLMRSFVNDYDNNEITTNFFTDGEIAIEVLSLFQKIPSKENIQAITDCNCWKIEFEVFQDFFQHIPGMSEWGRAWFTVSLFTMKQRSLSIIVDSAKDRYLQLVKEKPSIAQHAPLKNIASFLGITDTSLSRIRKEIMNG